MFNLELFIAFFILIASRKNSLSAFIDIKFFTSNVSNVTSSNSIKNTRHINIKQLVVSKLIKFITKRQRVKINVKEKNLKIT